MFCQILTPQQYDHAVKSLRPALLHKAQEQFRYDDAEDCVAIAVRNGFLNLSRFQIKSESLLLSEAWRSDLARWLYRILTHVMAHCHREKARQPTLRLTVETPSPQDVIDLRESAEQLALHDELYRRLERVSLTEVQDDTIRRWLGGQSQRSIASERNCHLSSVQYHLDKAIERLRGPDEFDIAGEMWLLFAECSDHATYHKPTGVWPDWMEQHPPDINLSALRRREERIQIAKERTRRALDPIEKFLHADAKRGARL